MPAPLTLHARASLQVKDKFKLEMDDEAAERFLIGIIDSSVSALWAGIIELGHRFAVSLK